jgi:hypothetical protein
MEPNLMNSEREIAFELLRRLLAGERGEFVNHLSSLLKRSSPLDAGDLHYRLTLPPDLANLRLSEETRDEIIAALCVEISRNPNEAFISAISFTGMPLATKTVAMALVNPPRPMTISEYSYALSLVNEYLPYRLVEDPEFLPKTDLERLVQVVAGLQDIEGRETIEDRVAQQQIKYFVPRFLKVLKQVEIGEWAVGPGPTE